MSTTVAGNRCAYCGTWLSGTEPHWCEKMHPNWSPSWGGVATGIDPSAPGGPLDRIADALQRIAAALEASNLDQIAAEKKAEKEGRCTECGRELHGYHGPLCRYCDPEAYSE